MEMYRDAYETYKRACEYYGLKSINFNEFVTHLTTEQINLFCDSSN